MTLYGSLIVNSTDTFSEHYCQNKSISTSININGNISYESILKHRKYGNIIYICVQASSGDRFTKVIVKRKSKITLKISLRARIRAFH
jgi:hypothetical protein